MIPLIEQHRTELIEVCERLCVQRLDLFGSAVKGTFKPESSDLDFIVNFVAPGERGYARRYYYFAEALEKIFQRPIDLLTEAMIGDAYFYQMVQQTRQPIYESRSQKSP